MVLCSCGSHNWDVQRTGTLLNTLAWNINPSRLTRLCVHTLGDNRENMGTLASSLTATSNQCTSDV